MRVVRIRSVAVGLALLAGCVLSLPAHAQSPCDVYTVQSGDTLSAIAQRAGIPGGFQILFSANKDVVTSPTELKVGMQLRIPCADGTLPGGAISASAEPAGSDGPAITTVPAASATAPAAAPGALPAIRFLTGGNFAPFTDESLPDYGLFAELVTTALADGDPDLDYKIFFINDWDSHLSALLPSGAFDMGFPWHLPDCSKLEGLSPENARRCTDFDASEPFFEAVVAFYTAPGGAYASAASVDALRGARICRPEGWFTFDLEAAGLIPPAVELMIGRIPTTCWQALKDGQVDVVTYDALTADRDIVALGLGEQVTMIPGLSSVATMHVLTPKSNPNGKAYLDILNRGLAQMRANGQWFAIVSKHLSANNQ